MEPNEPTTVIARWLAENPENAAHLREVYAADGATGLHQEVKQYFQAHDGGNAAVEQLAQWGISHDSPGIT